MKPNTVSWSGLQKTFSDLQADPESEWFGAFQNQCNDLVFYPQDATLNIAPLRFAAHVLNGGDKKKRCSDVEEAKKLSRTLENAGFLCVSPSERQEFFEHFLDIYISLFVQSLGNVPRSTLEDRVEKRRNKHLHQPKASYWVHPEFFPHIEANVQDDELAEMPFDRLQKLAQSAPPHVEVRIVPSVSRLRNKYVAEFCKRRAEGNCESCNQPAPFKRASDGTPYLEVHHVIPLSKGGLDVIDNVQALCPNCHRKAHFG